METEVVEVEVVVVAAARLTLTNALSSFFWCTACAASLASAPRFAPFVEEAAVSPLALPVWVHLVLDVARVPGGGQVGRQRIAQNCAELRRIAQRTRSL